MTHYTLGEIFRLGLLLNHKGEPYRHKASALKAVLKLKHTKVKTPWGIGYSVSEKELSTHNKQW